MDNDVGIADEGIIDNLGSDEDTTELERPNQEAEAISNASLARRRSGTESLHSSRPRQRRKMDPLHERLGDLMESITRSLAAPVVVSGTLNTVAQNEDHQAIGEAIHILRERFSKESSALHMRMGEIWSENPNRAIAFAKSSKNVQKRMIRKEKEALGRGYSSYGSGYLSYAKVGQCGCVVAGSGTTV